MSCVLNDEQLAEAYIQLLASSTTSRYLRKATEFSRCLGERKTDELVRRAQILLTEATADTTRTPAEAELAVILRSLADRHDDEDARDTIARVADAESHSMRWVAAMASWLRDRRPPTTQEVAALESQLDSIRVQKDSAYRERDQCIALIARLAQQLGLRVGLGRHEGGDWDDDWRYIVFVELSAQISWHIHDSELLFFTFLGAYEGVWDGHTTDEKYHRVLHAPIVPTHVPPRMTHCDGGRLEAVTKSCTGEPLAGHIYECNRCGQRLTILSIEEPT